MMDALEAASLLLGLLLVGLVLAARGMARGDGLEWLADPDSRDSRDWREERKNGRKWLA